MTIVETLSGIYTPLLQFIMTQQWLSLDPPIPRLSDTPASFLVMAILTQLTRTQAPRWFNHRKRIFSSFRRHGVIRRSMASDPTATETTRFDFLVIGGGSGGLAGARRASELGASTAVIESHKLGGTCVSKNQKNTVIPPEYSHSTDAPAAFTRMSVARLAAKSPDSFCGSFFFVCVCSKHCWKFKACCSQHLMNDAVLTFQIK